MNQIGIRREDKSRWEGRVPLVPEDVERLVSQEGVQIVVQSSPQRCIGDDRFRRAGAVIAEDLAACPVILGVKEIPVEALDADRTYIYFSHTIKGQAANMPALQRILDRNATLIDYEKIADADGRRLVAFGRFAGLAGMIDSLWALRLRLDHKGIEGHPFDEIDPAHRYPDLEAARAAMREVAQRIRDDGLPESLRPLVCGFTGYGQVSAGAQELFDLLPHVEVTPDQLDRLPAESGHCFKVVFREEHMFRPKDASGSFDLQEYFGHPERYTDAFHPFARHLTLLMNCIYWEPGCPVLLSREQFAELYRDPGNRLEVIGDITCDLDGSLACTRRSTTPDSPIYVYDPATGDTADGVDGDGPVVLAVDFLPCELPVDASRHFSTALAPFVSALARADLDRPLAESGLPDELVRATIVYRGQLTEPFRSLQQHLPS